MIGVGASSVIDGTGGQGGFPTDCREIGDERQSYAASIYGTYPLFTEYYKTNPGSDGVELFEKGGICDSEEESDNDN